METGNDQYASKILPENDPFDTLVLSGGSVNGITTLGALQYMYDHNKLQNIKNYYGTSIGSIIVYLLILGYNPTEILLNVISEKLIDNFKKINVLDIANGNGGFSWQPIDDFLIGLTLVKCEQPMSFEDLYNRYGVKYVCCTYNLSKHRVEYISYETHPKLLCTAGIRMSCNIPLLFPRYRYQDCYYIDGGIVDNFPISMITSENISFGINLSIIPNFQKCPDTAVADANDANNIAETATTAAETTPIDDESMESMEVVDSMIEGSDEKTGGDGFSLQEYIISVFTTPLDYHAQNNIKTFYENLEGPTLTQLLTIPTVKLSLNFTLSTYEQLEMFSYGYQYLKNYYE